MLVTADIHFEHLELDHLNEYIDYFKQSILESRPAIFCIAGDTTNSRDLKVGSVEFTLLTTFLTEIAKVCEENYTKFVILSGTPSHDGSVVKNIIHTQKLPIIYVDTICNRMIGGIQIFFLPEPYFPTYNEFIRAVKKNLNSKPDVVIFHGMFDFAIPQLHQIDSEFNNSRTVLIKSSDFKTIPKYLCIGGHYHGFIRKEDIWYTGQFINSRGKEQKSPENYGIRKIELYDEHYEVTTLLNPYLINTVTVEIETRNVSLNEVLAEANKYDPNQTLFVMKMDNSETSRGNFRQFKSIINPKYVRKLMIASDEELDTTEPVHIHVSGKDDIIRLLKEKYRAKFHEELKDEYLNYITSVTV